MTAGGVLRQAIRMLAREWRSGELRVLAIALALSVASVSAVGLLADRMTRALEQGASDLLGADLMLVSRHNIDPSFAAEAARNAIRSATTTTMRSVVISKREQKMQLVALKAVSKGYPLRGQLLVASQAYATATPETGIPGPGEAWADPQLLALLNITVGDTVSVGSAQLTIKKVIAFEPDRGGDFFSIAPRLLMSEADLDRTGLVQPGSRLTRRVLFAGTEDQITLFRQWLQEHIGETVSIQGVRDARPEIRNALARGSRFLSLASLVSVLLCGVAMAMAARQYTLRQLDASALLRCLGARRHEVLWLHITKLSLLAAIVSVLGLGLGWCGQWALAQLAEGLLFTELPAARLQASLSSISVGIFSLVGFALPPIAVLGNVPPGRVLRRDLTGTGIKRTVALAIALACVGALVLWQAKEVVLAAQILAGTTVTVLALLALAWLVVYVVSRWRDHLGPSWRFGVSNLARRPTASAVQVAAFGLGLSMLMLLTIVRNDLINAWQRSLPAQAPNYFLINVPNDEVDAVSTFIQSQARTKPTFYPMIRGHLRTRNGVALRIEQFTDPRAHNRLQRGFNLSHAHVIRADNRIIAGKAWSADKPASGEVSIERGVAEALKLKVGDELEFDVAGQRVPARLTSIREVDWDSFQVNFFVIASPGTLDGLAATHVTSFYLPKASQPTLVTLVRQFPAVTVIDVDALISKVRAIMDRASYGMQFVFVFTLLAGMVVLYAAIDATLDERRYESAMLRTFGASRQVVLKGLIAEFAVLGILSAALAALAANGLSVIVARNVLSLEYTPSLLSTGAAAFIGAVCVTLAGVIGTWSVLRSPPLRVLRQSATS